MSKPAPSFSIRLVRDLRKAACFLLSHCTKSGSLIARQIEVEDLAAVSFARKAAQELVCCQSEIALRFLSDLPISSLIPPIDFAQRNPSRASSTASIDGVLIVSPLKIPSINPVPFTRRKILGSGRGGL